MTGPLVATYRYRRAADKRQYIPVIHWQGGEYECGPALAQAADAIRFASDFAQAIRDVLHSHPYTEHAERLAL